MKKSLAFFLTLVALSLSALVGTAQSEVNSPASLTFLQIRPPTLDCCKCLGGVAELNLSTGQGGGPIDPVWRRTPGGPAYATTAFPGWTTTIPAPARWIQPVASTTPVNPVSTDPQRYTALFEVHKCTIPSQVFLDLTWAADNGATVFLNNVEIDKCTTGKCFNTARTISRHGLQPGINVLRFDVSNSGGPSGLIVNARLRRQCTREAQHLEPVKIDQGIGTGTGITPAGPSPSPTPQPTPPLPPPPPPTWPPKVELKDDYGFRSVRSPGLNTHYISFPSGSKLIVNLPDDVAAGDTFSGTVQAEVTGADEKQRARNQAELDKAVLLIGGQTMRVAERIFTRTISTLFSAADPFIVLQVKDKEVVKASLSFLETPTQPPVTFQLPSCGQMGRNLVVMHPGNGIIDPKDSSSIGGTQLQTLAESMRMRVIRNSSELPGLTQINFSEQGNQVSGPFLNVGVRLTSLVTSLRKGQTTNLDVVVSAPGIQRDLSLVLVNTTPGIVTISGGETQHFTLRSADVQADGTFRKSFTVSSSNVGAWGATATVSCVDDGPGARRN